MKYIIKLLGTAKGTISKELASAMSLFTDFYIWSASKYQLFWLLTISLHQYQYGSSAAESFWIFFPFVCWQFLCCGHFGHFWSLNPCSSHDLKFKSSHNLKFKSSHDEDATFHPISTHLTIAPIARPAGKARKAAEKLFGEASNFATVFTVGDKGHKHQENRPPLFSNLEFLQPLTAASTWGVGVQMLFRHHGWQHFRDGKLIIFTKKCCKNIEEISRLF